MKESFGSAHTYMSFFKIDLLYNSLCPLVGHWNTLSHSFSIQNLCPDMRALQKSHPTYFIPLFDDNMRFEASIICGPWMTETNEMEFKRQQTRREDRPSMQCPNSIGVCVYSVKSLGRQSVFYIRFSLFPRIFAFFLPVFAARSPNKPRRRHAQRRQVKRRKRGETSKIRCDVCIMLCFQKKIRQEQETT